VHILEMSTGQKVADAIEDDRNPMAQGEARRQRDQWIFEADTGTLQMSAETRGILEQT
jgi:hypothetical protein